MRKTSRECVWKGYEYLAAYWPTQAVECQASAPLPPKAKFKKHRFHRHDDRYQRFHMIYASV